MNPRVITTPQQYAEALAEFESLMELEPAKGSPDGDRLELFAFLLESYEKEHFPIPNPSPLDAIRFRMEQQNLSPKDLEPFIGSRSKVSELLAGKIPLSLRMIRELNRGLGIAYEVLVGDSTGTAGEIDWSKVPVSEMAKLGWIRTDKKTLRHSREQLAQSFFEGHTGSGAVMALLRRTVRARSSTSGDREALAAWLVEATNRSNNVVSPKKFEPKDITSGFLRTIAQWSVHANAPSSVRELLLEAGIILVVVPHLGRTRLDGAAFVRADGEAVVALTLRYDRLDSFWFTLLHELVHLGRHLDPQTVFVDDLDVLTGQDPLEQEADMLAREAVVSRQLWPRSDAHRLRTPSAVIQLAAEQKVHPALIAGRLRHETKNYHLLNNLVGHGQVRHLFREELGEE